jgi:hypothetical protein
MTGRFRLYECGCDVSHFGIGVRVVARTTLSRLCGAGTVRPLFGSHLTRQSGAASDA